MIAIASFTPSRRKKMNSNNTKDKFIPNSFQTPNAYVDEGIIALLTGDETKLLFIAIRHILGWADKRVTRQDNISLSQFQKSSGLARKTVIESMRRLARFNIVRMVKQGSPQDNEATLWELNLGQHGDINLDELEKRQDEQDGVNKMRIQKLNKAREEKKAQGGSHNPNHDVSSEPQPGSCDEPQPGSCDEPQPSSCDEHTKPIVNPLINSSIPGPVITPEGQVQSDLVEVKDHYPTPQEVIVSTDVSVPDTPEDGEKTQLEEKQIQGLPSKVAIEGQEPHGQDGQEQKGFTWENIAAILGTTMMNLNELDKQTLKGWIDRGITPLFVLDLLDSLSALPRKLYKMDKQVKTAWAKRDKTHENTPIPDINHNTRNNLGIGESENKKRSGMMDGLPGSSLEPTSCGYKPVEKNPRPPIIDPVMSRKERHEMYRQKLMEMEETP